MGSNNKPRARRRSSALATLIVATAFASAMPVSAEPNSWHVETLGYSELHEQGFTGEGITIAVPESGIDMDSPQLEGADVTFVPMPEECESLRDAAVELNPVGFDGSSYEDAIRHGTNVAAMIVGQGGGGRPRGVAPDAKLYVMEIPVWSDDDAVWPDGCDAFEMRLGARMMEAERLGADIISQSLVIGVEPSTSQLAYWNLRGKAFVVSAGNDESVSAASAGFEGVVTVTGSTRENAVTDWAARGPEVTVAAPAEDLYMGLVDGEPTTASGTSYAAPIVAGTLALGKQRWPEATYHQLIQSLVHTTINGDGTTRSDEAGYGVIDPRKFIETDPSQFPDEPLTYESEFYTTFDDEYRALFDGAVSDESMGYAEHYVDDAGPNPEMLNWIPQVALDNDWVGMAPDASHWGTVNGASSTSESAEREERSVEENVAQLLMVLAAGAVALAVIVVGIVAAVMYFTRKRKLPPQPKP